MLLFVWLVHSPVFASGIFYDGVTLRIELSEKVEEAVDSGIALTFESEFAHMERFLFASWPEQLQQYRFTVSRHELSNRYLIYNNLNDAPSMYRSKKEAMSSIAEQTLDLFKKYHDSNLHNNYAHQMRLSLSISDLPAPLRLSAFISSAWDLDSGWNTWQSAQ